MGRNTQALRAREQRLHGTQGRKYRERPEDDPRYIVDLLKRVVRVSVETVRIVRALPAFEEEGRKAE